MNGLMPEPRLIHIVTRGYLKRFAVDGQVMTAHARYGVRRARRGQCVCPSGLLGTTRDLRGG
jgi:hypothetical protein